MMSVNRKKYDMLGGIDSISQWFIKVYYRACFVDLHTPCIKFSGVLSPYLWILSFPGHRRVWRLGFYRGLYSKLFKC
jgi:hypothetical protein